MPSSEDGNGANTHQEHAIIIQPEKREQYFLCRLIHPLTVPGLSREGVIGSTKELRAEPVKADDNVAPDWAMESRFESLKLEPLKPEQKPASADSKCSGIVDKRFTRAWGDSLGSLALCT